METCVGELMDVIIKPELSFELGVVSQLVYKNSSAHRRHKYFQAIKKIDRHMHLFTSLKLVTALREYRPDSDDQCARILENKMTEAEKILANTEENCVETIKLCLPQLALKHFVTLHTLHICTVTNIWTFVKAMRHSIAKCLGMNNPIKNDLHKNQLGDPDTKTLYGGIYPEARSWLKDLAPIRDLGMVISREKVVTAFATGITEAKAMNEVECSSYERLLPVSVPAAMKENVKSGPMRNGLELRLSIHKQHQNAPLQMKRYHKSFLRHCYYHVKLRRSIARKILPEMDEYA